MMEIGLCSDRVVEGLLNGEGLIVIVINYD
jgi:hypothetical protein